MKRIWVIAVIFSVLLLPARTLRVVDTANRPIPGVIIKSGEQIYLSNEKGVAEIEIYSDSLQFSRLGYEKLTLASSEIPSVVQLQRQSVPSAGVKVISILPKAQELANLANGRIIKVQNQDLQSALQAETELQISQSGTDSSKQTISIGGLDPKYSLIMLNGIPMNRSGQEFDISTLPLEMVSEVEVITTNAGAIGGSGAVGGIVNFITQYPQPCSFQSSFGSFDHYKNQLQINHNFPKFQIGINAAYTTAQNDFTYDNQLSGEENLKRKNNAKKMFDVGLQLGWNSNSQWALKTFYQKYHKQLPGNIGSLTQFDRCFLEGESLKNMLNLNGEIGEISWESRFFQLHEFSRYDNSKSSGILNTVGKNFYNRYGNKSSLVWQKEEIKVEPGVEIIKQDFEYKELTAEVNSVPQTSMTNYAAFLHLQNKWLLFPCEFSGKLSLRHDIPQRSDSLDFQAFSSYHLSGKLEYENILQYAVGASWGNSYLLPSFYDLYWKGGLATAGNPNLKPEKSRGYQLFSQISYHDSYAKFTYSCKKLEDSIYWYKSLLSWKPGNIGGAEVSSYNLESKIALCSWAKLHFSWQRNFAYDRSGNSAYEGKFLTYFPNYKTKLGLHFNIENFQSHVSYQRTGKRWPSRDHLWGYLPAYETVDAAVSYRIRIGKFALSSNLQLNNLLNTKYQKYLLNPEPGFNWQAGMKIELKES